jgi:hypothetical protein
MPASAATLTAVTRLLLSPLRAATGNTENWVAVSAAICVAARLEISELPREAIVAVDNAAIAEAESVE